MSLSGTYESSQCSHCGAPAGNSRFCPCGVSQPGSEPAAIRASSGETAFEAAYLGDDAAGPEPVTLGTQNLGPMAVASRADIADAAEALGLPRRVDEVENWGWQPVWRPSAASNQPQRRLRPVVVPNSWPRSPSRCPSSSNNSVGNGPSPTRVV